MITYAVHLIIGFLAEVVKCELLQKLPAINAYGSLQVCAVKYLALLSYLVVWG